MKNTFKIIFAVLMIAMLLAFSVCAYASNGDELIAANTEEETAETETETEDNATGTKAWAAAIAIGVVAATGAISMGIAISKSVEGISRQPEAEGKIRTALMLGLVFVETAIIYALIVAILIIFVL
jgi:F-type H+-transporting ATPase subunit c